MLRRILRKLFGIKKHFETGLTTKRICDVLGVKTDLENEKYTSINFAKDTKKGGVAIISSVCSRPEYQTPEPRKMKLAKKAMARGAKLLISTEQIEDYPCLIVDNVFDAYFKILSDIRSKYNALAVSVTGSIGKTTTKDMIYAVLSNKYSALKSVGNGNTFSATAKTIQRLKKRHKYYVQEVAEGPPFGAPSNICKLIQPSVAVVTLIGTSHLETFGSQERILESCLYMQDGMPEDGLLILNADDPLQFKAICKRKTVYYGIQNEKADYRATNIDEEDGCIYFDLNYDGKVIPVRLNCFGKHNVLNALAAFAVGKWADMTDEEIAEGLANYHATNIRQNFVRYGGYNLYLDCYNAAPESVRSALGTVSTIPLPEGGRYVAVLADVVQYGEAAEECHRMIGKMAADSCIDVLFSYGDNASFIAEEAAKNKELKVFHTSSFDELVRLIKENITRNDVVLFKGSHAMELERVVDTVWGTWFHEDYEREETKTRRASDDSFRYRIYKDHATVDKKLSSAESLIIPDFIKDVPVTGIEKKVFNGSEDVKAIKFSNNLSNIRDCSFSRANLIEEIELPSSVKIVGSDAFNECEKLTKVTLSDGCIHIGSHAYANCKNLERITIPSSVHQIEDEAFLNCPKLTIYVESGSYAEEYAKEHNISFEVQE